MKILITGSSGLIGSSIISTLSEKDFEFIQLVRKPSESDNSILWDPETGEIDKPLPNDISVVINLCGQNLISRRWSKSYKKKIYDSRINSTRNLVTLIQTLNTPPRLLISASAVGYYGNKYDNSLTETDENGTGFLAKVCNDWEAATNPIDTNQTRVVHLRIGAVLSPKGGALKLMTPLFKLGLGGILGNGNQYMSWIAIDDVINVIEFIIKTESITGPINTVAPDAKSNKEFTKTLGHVLSRPTILPTPATILRLALGEVADEVLLSSSRVIPEKLERAGFTFTYPQLDDALHHLLFGDKEK